MLSHLTRESRSYREVRLGEAMSQEISSEVTISEKSMEVLIAKFIPTSQYFEERFNALEDKFDYKFEFVQHQIAQLQEGQNALKKDMDARFGDLKRDVDDRLEQASVSLREFKQEVNGRFEQVDRSMQEFKRDVDKRFEQVDKRFEQVDKRFEQVDKRFEQVDKRFEQVDKRFEQVDQRFNSIELKLDKLLDKVDTKIDKGLMESRTTSIKLFTFAMTFSAISMAALIGKLADLF
jgi:chromosome segregation ATPase